MHIQYSFIDWLKKALRYFLRVGGVLLIVALILANSFQSVSAYQGVQNPPNETMKSEGYSDPSCLTQQKLVELANERVLIEIENGNLLNWDKAEADPEPFPYYDLDGRVVVFMVSIIQAEKVLGYVVIDASTCQVVEFSENLPWHLHSSLQSISIADQWGFSIDISHPLYLGPFDKYFVLTPGGTAGMVDGAFSYRLLLNMMDYSYLILDQSGNRLIDFPDGRKISKPDFLVSPEDNALNPIPLPTAIVTPSAKTLSIPYYLQFTYGECWVGCTPTAGGTLMGYWAQRGYPNVAWGYDGSGRPNDTIIRLHDLAGTWCCSGVGCTWYANLSPALTTVFHERGYPGSSSQYIENPSFEQYRSEIDMDRPVVANFMGYNGGQWIGPDHSTTGLGYETAGGNFMIVNPNLASYYSPVYVYYGANYSGFYINTLIPPAADSAAFASQSVYPTVAIDSSFQIWFELTNNGTSTWTPGSYWLQNTNNMAMGALAVQPITTNVLPGQTYRWSINMTAPSVTGTYRTQWAISHNDNIFGPPNAMYLDVTTVDLCSAVTEIPKVECDVLVTLYNSTDGVNWTNHTNWLQTNAPCSWYGIHCAGGHVTEVTLHGNNLSGSIPAQLGNLSYLTGLWLYDNQLTGSIPPELGNLTNLTELALYINQLSGPIPLELGNLTKLEWLNLSRNQLTGSIPPAFGNLTQLQGLYLFRNQLTGPIPAGLGNLVNLTELYLNENQLSGSIPFQIQNLIHLTKLNLSRNQLSGSIPPELGNLTYLTELWLDYNQLTGTIPPELGNLTNLTGLGLAVNQLTGNIPPELGNLTQLVTGLWLNVNQLSGPIPSELGNLTHLTWLNLGDNRLTGNIPPEIGNLTQLTGIVLWKNSLSGSIPPELGNLTKLVALHLDENNFTGGLPSDLGNLTQLQRLYLAHNHFSGEFPTSITNLANLTMLTFDCWITSSDPAVITFVENLVPGWQNNACPSLLSPLDNETLDNGRYDRQDNIVWNFDWSDVPNAAKYHLYVIHNGASIPLIDDDEITEGSSYHYTGAGAYIDSANLLDWTWMVRAYINGAWGEWSEVRTFNVEPLNTDPPLQFANTFVGGTGNDAGNAIAVDADGNMYITGVSNAAWGAPIQAHNGGVDAFVARLDSNGNLVWNTFLGGAGDDWGSSIAIDASGNVYLAGGSDTTWGSPLRAHAGDSDAFVAKLDSSGHLVWNTFLGGSGYDEGFLTLDNNGDILVAGGSSSTWGAPLHAYNGYGDAFAARLNSSGGLVWNTFLGGAGGDEAWNLTTDGSNLYLTGYSDQTWGTPVRAYSGGFSDAFAAKLDASGAVLWNTFLGGAEHDEADGIAVAPNGNVYVSGFSDEGAGGMATWGDPVRPFSGSRDAFAAGLDPSGVLLWNTFLGGAGGDGSNNIAMGKDGSILVVGGASSSWGNPMSGFAGTYDGFIARLSPTGILTGNTFLGGSNLDTANDIALDANGRAFIAGYSASEWGNPITGYAGGSQDAFVAKVDLSMTFTDVPASYWAWPFIQRLSNAGVTGGCSANPVMYCPETPVNRAQMAVFLLRGRHGSAYNPPAASGTVFRDIPATHWAAAWIEQLQAEGITTGCGNGNYCPDTTVTRDQMAVFLLRARYGSSYAPPTAIGSFADVPVNYWAAAWIEQLAKEGITTGCGGGNYCPTAMTNRAQMAVFLVKTFDLP